MPDDDLRRADAALRARHESPTDARRAALDVLAEPELSPTARRVALWALGLAERELNRLPDAETHLREALQLAAADGEDGDGDGDQRSVAQIQSALVAVVAARGRPDEALAIADAARPHLPDDERADLEMKRALVLEQLGRLADAGDAYDAALAEISRGADRVLEARALANRSIVRALQGRVREALDDTIRAEQLAAADGQWFLAGGAAHNAGYTAGLQGDVVAALESFARADAFYQRVGYPGRSAGVLASDRCHVLLAAGLVAEARREAERAVATLDAVDDVSDLAEARLLLARACLAAGDVATAQQEAESAASAFTAAGREGWALAAAFVAFCATAASGDATMALDRATGMADDLDRLGWTSEATAARVTAGDVAVSIGDVDRGRLLLEAAASARRRGRADHRAAAWLATARLRLVDGDRRGAGRAVIAGLRVLDLQRATVGATDLRAGVAAHGRGLADIGLTLALERRRPADVLTWAERVRANALEFPSVRPPDDTALANALTELRRLRVALDDERRAGLVDPATMQALARQEATVRDLSRLAAGDRARAGALALDGLRDGLRGVLGQRRRLVEFVEVDGELAAVVVGGTRDRLHLLGPIAPVVELVGTAAVSLDRLARVWLSPASAAASWASLRDVSARLRSVLLEPLGVDDDELVIVPTGVLHGVPWGALDDRAPRPLTIATSARRWLSRAGTATEGDGYNRRSRRGPGRSPADIGVITGTGLDHATREAAAVREAYDAGVEIALDATVETALGVLGQVTTAHIVCHGHLRSDSPMFSSLQLTDGPLTVYDIEAIAEPPALVVMPACHAGAATVSAGDELIGTAAALLGAGVRTVVAPLTTVNDEATVAVMAELHRHLAAGQPPPAALAATRAALADAPLDARAAAASLLCLM